MMGFYKCNIIILNEVKNQLTYPNLIIYFIIILKNYFIYII